MDTVEYISFLFLLVVLLLVVRTPFLTHIYTMKNFTEEIGPEQSNGGRIRRCVYSPDKLVETPHDDVRTLYDVITYSANKFGKKHAFGYRKVEQVIEEEKEVVKVVNGEEQKTKKKWKYFQLSGYQYLSYLSVQKLAHEIGQGFRALGLKEHAKVEIFSATKQVNDCQRIVES